MIPHCLNCTRKHLAYAEVLMGEACLGYPAHADLAIGQLHAAELEILEKYPEIAKRIREERLNYEDAVDAWSPWAYHVPTMELLELVRSERARLGELNHVIELDDNPLPAGDGDYELQGHSSRDVQDAEAVPDAGSAPLEPHVPEAGGTGRGADYGLPPP